MICMTQMIMIQMFLVIASPLEIEFLSKLSGPAPCLVQIVGWNWQWWSKMKKLS